MHEFASSVSTTLLHDIASHAVCGLPSEVLPLLVASLFEQYKRATNRNIKGNKGLHKELQ